MNKIRPSVFILICSVASGILAWMAWPERGFTPLIFFAFTPLLWMDYFVATGKVRRSGIRMFGNFFLSMMIWNSLTTWWIWNSTDVGSIVALALNSFFMAIVWQLFYITKRQFGSFWGYLSLVIYWIAFEYLHLNWEISWPWLTLGNVFATKPEWIQWYEFTGTLGGTLWVWLINILVFLICKSIWTKDLLIKIRRINTLMLSSLLFIIFLLPLTGSLYMYHTYRDTGDPVNVAVIQPNIDPYNEKFNGTSMNQLTKILRLTSTVIDTSTDFVICPETALPDGIWEENLNADPEIQFIKKFISPFPGLNFITGLSSYKAYPSGQKASLTARKFKDADAYYDAYNSAVQIDMRDSLQIYHKTRLVPGVEKMPYPKIFGFLESYALSLGGTSGSLGTQQNRTNFIGMDGTLVAPAICYESIYGDFMAAYIRNGAQFIAIMTNDGWWGNTPGYRQHMNYSRLRAVEFRKSIARSANTGISCFINQRGDILQQTSWWQEDALQETLLKNNIRTFYARHGDYPGFIASFLSASILVFMSFRKLIFK
ncbi:MAG TPA: apolipoprotein N-acyltransferase [Bacteroidia bacterium]|nr:apolipoprotein N-acyltransferase [Bacteroidia bacterium]